MYTHSVDAQSPAELARDLRGRLQGFMAPLLRTLDFRMDARLVRTFAYAVEAIVVFRNRTLGLLL